MIEVKITYCTTSLRNYIRTQYTKRILTECNFDTLRVIVARAEWKESAHKVKKSCNFYCHCKRNYQEQGLSRKGKETLISIINPSIYCIIRTARLRHLNQNMMT
jgi:hypothetical protein